jgi:hypothetical protein
LSETRDRLLRKGDYVQGSFLKPEQVDGYLNGVNPGDRSDALGRFPFSEANADQACDFAASAARLWRRVPLDDRAVAVRRFREALAQHQEPTARLLTREVGKPLWEARQEVQATLRALDLHLDDGLLLLAPRVIEEIGARSDRMPRGTTAVLAPFAFPLLVPAVQCAAALLAGNSVVLKPSKFTPGVGQVAAGCRAGSSTSCRGPARSSGSASWRIPRSTSWSSRGTTRPTRPCARPPWTGRTSPSRPSPGARASPSCSTTPTWIRRSTR